MNYRHQYHAGNFADVLKHALLVELLRAYAQKPKGFVFLDTHAGRGGYDLSSANRGDSLERKPEWPDGIGRLWTDPDVPEALRAYVSLVRDYQVSRRGEPAVLRYYPGSPWLAAALARPVDRLVFCEKHPDEYASLAAKFAGRPRTSVQRLDGYVGVRAVLPGEERRAVVLIDPPYEAQDEFTQVLAALRAGLERLPSAVMVLWYPLTWRAQQGRFLTELTERALPPTLACELDFEEQRAEENLHGCGLLVVNPPWQFAARAEAVLAALRERLTAGRPGAVRLNWIAPER